MPAKQIRVATWEYRNEDGKRRRAYFGQTVELTDDEVARGEAAGVFNQPLPVVASEPEPDSDAPELDPEAVTPAAPTATERPANVASKATWEAYGIAHGLTAAEVDEMTKAEINTAVEAKKAQA